MDGNNRGGMRSLHAGLASRLAGGYQNGNKAHPRAHFPNIKDLQDQASSLDVNEDTSVCPALSYNGR